MPDATGPVTDVLTVDFAIAGLPGPFTAIVELIAGYSTMDSVPNILAARLGVAADSITITRTFRHAD
jgi:hypothetical protein